ncbi:hypothetical protein Q5P01_000916 [Channa striata]|uniref:Uncharacterized protein n=1 Tax=Channa striata TaxID=64152 RepID=A0AA88LM64_CHASR|nr:hypothetical protein Q5P01_000916 [Channa striata]
MDIKVPCNMQPFSFGSGPPPFALQPCRASTRTRKPKSSPPGERREGPGFAKRRQSRGPRSAVLLGSADSDRVGELCAQRGGGVASSLRRRASLLDNGVSEMGRRSDRAKKRRRSLQACRRRGCDSVCSAASGAAPPPAVSTAARDYGRALREVDFGVRSFDCRREHSRGAECCDGFDGVGPALSHSPTGRRDDGPQGVDRERGLRRFRLRAVRGQRCGGRRRPLRSTGKFLGRMNFVEEAALLLSFQLNFGRVRSPVPEALARFARVLSPTWRVAPGFRPSSTGVPAASRSPHRPLPPPGSCWRSGETVEPVSLSRWYMALSIPPRKQDLLAGQEHVERLAVRLQEPICDRRGLCDPLELKRRHPGVVRRQAGREVSSECPLACGSPCLARSATSADRARLSSGSP